MGQNLAVAHMDADAGNWEPPAVGCDRAGFPTHFRASQERLPGVFPSADPSRDQPPACHVAVELSPSPALKGEAARTREFEDLS